MREIEFRGKDALMGWWLYGSLLIEDDQYYIHCKKIPGTNPEIFEQEKRASKVDTETVGQYTGHKATESCRGNNEDDKKLFDGDVFTTPEDDEPYEVTWDEFGLQWVASTIYSAEEISLCEFGKISIIGNRWDMPEIKDK
jgi:hypothetical protein